MGIAAAAQIGSLADYLDLDGNLLVANDPYQGIRLEKGRLYLSDLPGLGVIPRAQVSPEASAT